LCLWMRSNMNRDPCDRAWRSRKRANSRSPLQVLAEWTGLEPATPGVTGRYSNQLNYHSGCCLPLLARPPREARWWVLTGSNRRHSPCKGDALPAELSTRTTGIADAFPSASPHGSPRPAAVGATPAGSSRRRCGRSVSKGRSHSGEADQFSASFSAFPARNLGTLPPLMLIASPVRGLRPARGLRLPT
jgi:hypothetical protein